MELDVSRIRAVCFDIDGTLRDTDDALAARLLPWLRPLGYFNRQFKPHNLARRIIMRIENPGNYLLGLHDRIGIDELLLSVSKLRKKEEVEEQLSFEIDFKDWKTSLDYLQQKILDYLISCIVMEHCII